MSVLVIAEIGVNHDGDMEKAKALIDAAKAAGADRVKFQSFVTRSLVTDDAPTADYQRALSAEKQQAALLAKLELSFDQQLALYEYAKGQQIPFLSTPFDHESLDFLTQTLSLPLLKLSSGDLTNGPLLLSAARSSSQLILSTGMASMADIEQALKVVAFGALHADKSPTSAQLESMLATDGVWELLAQKVVLLHCTSAYPTPAEEANLSAITTLKNAFPVPVGYSDHTMGTAGAIGAVALGASVIEKHITLDCTSPGPDHAASIEPDTFADMVKGIRFMQQALGSGVKFPSASELDTRVPARKSLVALKPIKAGESFTSQNLGCKRPGNGMSPMLYWSVLGKTARRDYAIGDLLDE
ncbi:N-acetylneuraminate synthase [Aestuariibacter halophilus]|uniref:N-acetylneuraminate synthase n=1 Tax=Fluctibacter halophilus TaxID=226011 RepID=A0ABS8G3R9_9ALTE|nr:N-acetylneuraminate synthase [Aestuariibacter halophilus]MCC2615128.1 N-acetylneuraminate synthase [Aestuariibacter halophilus]